MHIDSVLEKAEASFVVYKKASGRDRAKFLLAIANEIETLGEELLRAAHEETNLPIARLTGERSRTMGQLKLFADLIDEGTWVEATIDTAIPDRKPLPRVDLRRMLLPLGPVVVFGASNFPFAFSTAGGDTASALAAGCPVIYKEHPGHPKTSQLVYKAISKALETCQLPPEVFQHVSGGVEVGQELVAHPKTSAVAFTGSFKGGKAIFDSACQRKQPIPVFAEMGSVNPIVVLPEKSRTNPQELAAQAAQSVLLGVGQFCTNPGLIFYPEADTINEFLQNLTDKLQNAPAEKMLHAGICGNYFSEFKKLINQKGVEPLVMPEEDEVSGKAGLARVSVQDWLKNPALQEEVFGPFTLVVTYKNTEELKSVAKELNGQLTITLWGCDDEHEAPIDLIDEFREKCGRLLFEGVPTGVEVSPAMTHGGPFPATTDSRSTSVGTYAIKRFARPFTFQSAPQRLLPEELKDENTLNIWRTVNNELTKDSIQHPVNT
jgi:2,5-dioxopentanoate dehydrogenase